MISFEEFEILKTCIPEEVCNLELLCRHYEIYTYYKNRMSKEKIIQVYENLCQKGYLQDFKLTPLGMAELNVQRVENAVILAAGGADISAKTVYSLPKGLFKINGEVLIERQIRQLQEAGISQIYVVVGIKKEMYFYLEEKFGVKLIINPYPKKNNVYSLYAAVYLLGNTYVCNCDNYFEKNPFSQFESRSFHATIYKETSQKELLIKKNLDGRITSVYTAPDGGECIYGHAFFSREFSERFRALVTKEIGYFRIDSLFWEEFFGRHIDDLDMYVQDYEESFLKEFDTIQEVQEIDNLFVENVNDRVIHIICEVLQCEKHDIYGVEISEKGLTNLLFTFEVRGVKYIFRYPGESSADIVYRKNEVYAQRLAAACGVDSTLIYIDETGCKISRYVENSLNLSEIYYKDIDFMKRLAEKIQMVHSAGRESKEAECFFLDPVAEADRLLDQASRTKGNLKERFRDMRLQIIRLYEYTKQDCIEKTICHNDINADNCLLTVDSFDVIDWEFAGYNDPAFDFGRVLAEYEFEDSAIDEILCAYFHRDATPMERLHWIAYIGIHNWYYVCWALFKESINEDTREWMLFFYEKVKKVLQYAIPAYEKIYAKEEIKQ